MLLSLMRGGEGGGIHFRDSYESCCCFTLKKQPNLFCFHCIFCVCAPKVATQRAFAVALDCVCLLPLVTAGGGWGGCQNRQRLSNLYGLRNIRSGNGKKETCETKKGVKLKRVKVLFLWKDGCESPPRVTPSGFTVVIKSLLPVTNGIWASFRTSRHTDRRTRDAAAFTSGRPVKPNSCSCRDRLVSRTLLLTDWSTEQKPKSTSARSNRRSEVVTTAWTVKCTGFT